MSGDDCVDHADVEPPRLRGADRRELLVSAWLRLGPQIRNRCLRILRDPDAADDLAQETFLRALSHLESYRDGDLAGWLWTIARNLCLNKLRSAAARHERPWPEEFDVAGPVIAPLSDGEEAGRLVALLESLPERQRVVLKLFYLDAYTYEEIVRLTGFSLKEVKSAIQNGRRMLRKKFDAG